MRIKTKFYAKNSMVANIMYAVSIVSFLVLIQAFFSSTLKGNTATGIRRFGVLIDQVRFHEYINTVSKLIFYSSDRATQKPSNLPAQA